MSLFRCILIVLVHNHPELQLYVVLSSPAAPALLASDCNLKDLSDEREIISRIPPPGAFI